MVADEQSSGRLEGASTADLVSRAASQVSTLVRDELALARTEITAKAKQAGIGGGLFGSAAVLALYGTGLLIALVAVALDMVWPLWLAVLVVLVGVLAIAVIMAMLGRSQIKRSTPRCRARPRQVWPRTSSREDRGPGRTAAMTQETPLDAEALRAEIARTRADLGETVAALVAKTDLKARTKDAVTSAADQAKDKVRTVRKQATELATERGGAGRGGSSAIREPADDARHAAGVRRPLQWRP